MHGPVLRCGPASPTTRRTVESRLPSLLLQPQRHHRPHHRSHHGTHRHETERTRGSLVSALASSDDNQGEGGPPLKAEVGDTVTVHWSILDDQGDVVESSRSTGEPTTFEVGAGDIVGNELFEAFDEAVRGLTVGETIGIKADGPAWTEELMFNVPMDHPEIERMNGRYKNQGGCKEGLLAELSNGGMAVVVKVDEEAGMVVLDANSMMSGKSMIFELELLDIARD